MKKYRNSRAIAAIFLVTAIFFSPGISISSAEESLYPPQIPQTFFGTLKFKNNNGIFDAPYGTRIEAFIGDIEKGSTSVMSSGNYEIDIFGTVEDDGRTIRFKSEGYFAEQTAIFNASVPPETLDLIIDIPEPYRQSSGGAGGGGGASGEDYNNIEIKEKYEESIYKDKLTSYQFKNLSNPVIFVNITGNVSAGPVNVIVEVLRGKSTLVKEAPPGIVYKNINIWIGPPGFATLKNIKEETIMFRVHNSWIDNNSLERSDIQMVMWDNGSWITPDTSGKMKDGTYTYFEVRGFCFSSLAITGIKRERSTQSPGVTPTQTATSVASDTGEKPPVLDLSVIIGVMGLIGIVMVLYLKKK